jgi:8-oxo-dGTP pyrophosphatase MutT (NUDIX family)
MDAPGPPPDFTATLATKRMASGVLFQDATGRVLLVEPTYKDPWEIPGGSVDADESPYDAAVREVQEELGLFVEPGRLLVVDWVPSQPGRTEGVMFVYDGGVLDETRTAVIRLPADELRSWAWCTLDETRRRASDLLARRVAAAAQARITGATSYLELGHQVA